MMYILKNILLLTQMKHQTVTLIVHEIASSCEQHTTPFNKINLLKLANFIINQNSGGNFLCFSSQTVLRILDESATPREL